MQALGWIGILIGLLHFGETQGVILLILGIAVVYVVRKSKVSEIEFTRRLFQAKIKRTKRIKKVRGMARQQDGLDFPTETLPALANHESKGKSTQKSDWFIYSN